ncbi:hypothetical protein, conserved [Trypanosoma brucei gambiense DAL972]|uniref:EngB-type G domain-containing protein n=1 Tax=Trypanosoma brucei gambiense (strain MHOM/CI/86/DAL972) TaxID=679716 RepID=C9ZSF9_TRYB9|nr:hypothetical protein, conserved [Trypanosoma brucei gambiense DAL972]CBH12343.1 hypothetical protein, conserved [Trypanosoma brucei gambiense DAL972]|eukprot:XP_011774624.1 hypothetical protein, conserved [Trypanosoma brucei gambiense DAL972]
MPWLTPLRRCGPSAAFDLLGRMPLRSRPHYTQQQSDTRKVMDGDALLASSKRRDPNGARLALMDADSGCASDVLCTVPDTTDDDIVLDPSHGRQLQEVSAAGKRMKFGEHHPATRGIGTDVIDLVTDAFKEARERLVEKRRRVLYQVTHPDPSDYTYNGKLVPAPPLSFGRITEEAISLGNKVMLGQHYSLVKQAGMYRDDEEGGSAGHSTATSVEQRRCGRRRTTLYDQHTFFFEINDLYQEIVLVGKACAGKSSLLNALLGQQVAKTSSTPNTTRKLSFYQSVSPEEMQRYLNVKGNGLVKLPGGGLQLTFVDVPGFGLEGMSEQWRDKAIELTDAYLGVRRSVNTLLLCIDCERGLTKVDLRYFTWLENLHGVFFVVLTKCDSVPHSRVCSVMRQIYSVITKNRRKYRKVFPFIIPTSANDGTNIEMLRGLIAETSGLIPGDRLRKILKAKADAEMRLGLEKEEERIREARCLEARMAKAYFESTRSVREVAGKDAKAPGLSLVPSTASSHPPPQPPLHTKPSAKERKFVLSLDCDEESTVDAVPTPVSDSMADEPLLTFQNDDDAPHIGKSRGDSKLKRRERFLAWRRAHPLQRHASAYGVFRLNTGLERPDTSTLELTYGDGTPDQTDAQLREFDRDSALKGEVIDLEVGGTSYVGGPVDVANHGAQLGVGHGPGNGDGGEAPGRTTELSAVIGAGNTNGGGNHTLPASSKGGVSRFLNLIDQYAQRETQKPRSKREQAKEARWRARLQKGSGTKFFAEESDGRVAEYKAGKKFGPSLISAACDDVAGRRAQWEAHTYMRQAVAARPTAPWAALEVLKRRTERVKQDAAMRGMTKKECEAYLRNCGRVTEKFEEFEGEVTAAKYMNETRHTKTLRSQQQMHLNSTSKISYRSMPVGLWKHYGERETYWPTPRVKGR